MYSQSFYDSLLDKSKPIKDVFAAWRDAYFTSMKAVRESKEWEGTNKIPFEKGCEGINELVRLGLPMCAPPVGAKPRPPNIHGPEPSASLTSAALFQHQPEIPCACVTASA